MRVGVTGSHGFIGSALVDALTARGDSVVRFVRTSVPAPDSIRWDPSTGDLDEADLRAVGQLDAIVNLAGVGIASHRWTPAYRASVLTSRTAATAAVTAAAAQLGGVERIVNGSAVGFYGNRGVELVTEESPAGSDYVAEVCQKWEAAAAPLSAAGSTVAFARTGIVLGRGGGVLERLLPMFRLGGGGVVGTGTQWLSPISLSDEVRALIFLMDERIGGAVNLVGPQPCTYGEFVRALGHQMHRPTLVKVPSVMLRLALGRELADNTVLTSQRVLPGVLTERGFHFTSSNVVEILAHELG